MYYRTRFYELISALQKSVRWCEVNASRYFAHQVMEMGLPGAVFKRLILLAAEDVGLADPLLIVYERRFSDEFEKSIKQKRIKKREAVNFPELCELVDRAAIAAGASYKSRLLPMLSFSTLFDIYQNEDFGKTLDEYLHEFVKAIQKRNERQALYYAYIVDVFIGERDRLLAAIQKHSGRRNEELIRLWVDEFKRDNELLVLAGCVVMLCRDLNYDHGEYSEAISRYLSLPIRRVEIPDRAYDKHTSIGKKRGRGFNHFFDEAATVKNERFPNKWEKAGRRVYLLANKEGLGKTSKIIEAIKEKCKEKVPLEEV